MLEVQRGMRALGSANRDALDKLHAYANDLRPLRPGTEGQRIWGASRYVGKTVPIRLSKLRVLDILLWADVAQYGSTPNPGWSQASASMPPAPG